MRQRSIRRVLPFLRARWGYTFYAAVAQTLTGVYFIVPPHRDLVRDEVALWQKRATMQAHKCRMTAQKLAGENDG